MAQNYDLFPKNTVSDTVKGKIMKTYKLTNAQFDELQAAVKLGLTFDQAYKMLTTNVDTEPAGDNKTLKQDMNAILRAAIGR